MGGPPHRCSAVAVHRGPPGRVVAAAAIGLAVVRAADVVQQRQVGAPVLAGAVGLLPPGGVLTHAHIDRRPWRCLSHSAERKTIGMYVKFLGYCAIWDIISELNNISLAFYSLPRLSLGRLTSQRHDAKAWRGIIEPSTRRM